MVSDRDLYGILGVSRDADAAALKKAYRSLAKKYHPDANPGNDDAEQKFKEVSAAYEILKDSEKRALYDRHGMSAFQNGGGGGGGFGPDFAESMSSIFDDLFGDLMGGGRRRSRGGGRDGHGRDLQYQLEIDLRDAYLGKEMNTSLPIGAACSSCHGSGAAANTEPSVCVTCGGRGRVRTSQGFFTMERGCPACQGEGRIITSPCRDCQGSGRVSENRTLKIDIPAGIEDGSRIRMSGKGEAGIRGGASGDLYITISIRSDDLFQRDGAHLFCRVPVSSICAALGGEMEIPSINGKKLRITIPQGVQSGKQFRLKGKGMPILRSRKYGDLYIQLAVETPVDLSNAQRDLLRQFESTLKDSNHPLSSAFESDTAKLSS